MFIQEEEGIYCLGYEKEVSFSDSEEEEANLCLMANNKAERENFLILNRMVIMINF